MNKEIEPTTTIEKYKYLNRMDESFRTICSLISHELLFHISSCKTPNESWTTMEGIFGKHDEMRGHMLEVELLTLDPKSFNNIQYFFTKYKYLLSQLKSCKVDKYEEKQMVLTILIGKRRIELTNEIFENVLHVPKLSVNLLSVYQMKNYITVKRVIFILDVVDIYDMQTNSMVSTGEVNYQSRLYTFSEFIEPDYALLLTHADERSRIWHKIFGHLNFIYMKQLRKQGMVDGLPNIHFSKGICEGCLLGKHPQEKFDKGKTQKASSPLYMIHSDLMGPFPRPSIKKTSYVLIFVDDLSCFTWIFFLRKKLEVFQHLKDFKACVETQSGKKIHMN
jgi:hypothetical protein